LATFAVGVVLSLLVVAASGSEALGGTCSLVMVGADAGRAGLPERLTRRESNCAVMLAELIRFSLGPRAIAILPHGG